MAPTSLMSIFPLQSLRTLFQKNAGFLDSGLFETFKEADFSPSAWTVLSMLKIPTAKDLIMRLAETNRDAGLEKHFSLIYKEFKDYLTSRGFPLNKDDIHPIFENPRRMLGTITCSQNDIHLTSSSYFDFNLTLTSATSTTAPTSAWHTKLQFTDILHERRYELLMRNGDRAIMTNNLDTPPLQIEHLGFEGEQARLRLRSNVMMLDAPK